MAKLSARGRTEIVRIVRETEGEAIRESLRKLRIVRQRASLVLMSDRTVLQKVDTWYQPSGEVWDKPYAAGTWRKRGKLKTTENADSFVEAFQKPRANGEPSGWKIAVDNRAVAR
jgi:hypothetical protein